MGSGTQRVQYHLLPRVAIKAQALGDFVSEMTLPLPSKKVWLLHVDGSSTLMRCVAGVVLTTPEGDDLEFVKKFDFKASNNEAEYETLVIGMKMAREARARHFFENSNS